MAGMEGEKVSVQGRREYKARERTYCWATRWREKCWDGEMDGCGGKREGESVRWRKSELSEN